METFDLPDQGTIMDRLTAIDNNPHMVEQLYPRFAGHGGKPLTTVGLVMALQLAVSDYTIGLPPVVTVTTNRMLHLFVPAFTDDEAVRAEVLDLFRQVGLPTG